MKKSIVFYIIIISSLFVLVGCGPTPPPDNSPPWDSSSHSLTEEPPTEEPSTEEPPTEEPPTEEPPTEEPPTGVLDVLVDIVFDDCSCGGDFQKATVNLTINDGEAPYNISDIGPVFPDKNKLVTFDVSVGSSFPLIINSSDGLSWEPDDNIDASPPYACQPPPSCSSESNNNNSCHEEEVCIDTVTTIEVCGKWTGNGKKCLEWEEKDIITTTCHMELVCD